MNTHFRFVRRFLKSSEATASGFSCVGWDHLRKDGEDVFATWVDYGILSEMELDVILEKNGGWYLQMYVPPVRPWLQDFATHVCEQIAPECGLVAVLAEDGSVLVGATGEGDIEQKLPLLWRAFDDPAVYEVVLVLCGISDAPQEEEDLEYGEEEDAPYLDTQEET